MVFGLATNTTSLSSDQLRPVPRVNTAIEFEHVLTVGSIDQRMLVDIGTPVARAEMALVEQALQ